MEWFNIFGLAFITAIMIPNIIFALKHKEAFENRYHNKTIEIIEQIGRFGCFGFMIFNIPTTWFGWWSDEAFAIYLMVDAVLIVLYCTIWVIYWRKNNVFKAMALSIIPSAIQNSNDLPAVAKNKNSPSLPGDHELCWNCHAFALEKIFSQVAPFLLPISL